jgi:hypothetical protein
MLNTNFFSDYNFESFGYFCSNDAKAIKSGEFINVGYPINFNNIVWDGLCIKIMQSGLYCLNFVCQFNNCCQIIFCINTIPALETIVNSTINNFIIANNVIMLNTNDTVSILNYNSDIDIQPKGYMELKLWKIN